MELTLDQALQKGVEAHKAGKAQEADRYYTVILKANPKHSDANHNMGVLAVGVGKVEEALPFFKTALESNPNIAQYWLSYIDALIKLKRLAEAKTVFDQAKNNGADGEVFDEIEQHLAGRGKDQEPSQDQQQLLINLHSQGQHQEALNEAKKLLIKFPNSFNLYNIIGASNKRLGKLDEAVEAYTKAISIKPDYADAYYNMGLALQDLGKLDEAIEAYTKAITIKPDYADAYYNMGLALQDLGKLDEAIEAYTKAITIKPDYADAYYNLGIALKEQGKLGEAIEAYTKAITIKPDYADAYYNMGLALQEQGKLDEAIEAYTKAITIKPDYAKADYNMGNALQEQGKLDEAIEVYTKAITIKPDYAEAYYNMGLALRDQGKLDEAIEAYTKAITIKPEYAEAYNNMGNALQEQGKLDEAIEAYTKVITIKPDYADVYYNMGLALRDQGKLDEAASFFRKNKSIKSQTWLLKCLYELNNTSHFYEHLDYLISQGENNAIIGSYTSRSKIRYGINRENPFCNEPLKYVLKIDLLKKCDFQEVFVKGAVKILNEGIVQKKKQDLIMNGNQTAGNVFGQMGQHREKIQDLILMELENYRFKYKESGEGLIINWPTSYRLNGWIVKYKNGGAIKPHMHEEGWISGSVYINVPPELKDDSGNLVVCIESETDQDTHSKSIDVVTGSLCLFPSSLLHYTIPFKSNEDRTVLAFDMIPN